MLTSQNYVPTILLVDDYPAGRLVGSLLIEHLGYAVETASSGLEAIEKVRNAVAPYMAILMDIQLPDISGFDVTQTIRVLEQEKNHHNIIIAVTAHIMAGDRKRCLQAGMDDYIGKPINPELLGQKLAALIQNPLQNLG